MFKILSAHNCAFNSALASKKTFPLKICDGQTKDGENTVILITLKYSMSKKRESQIWLSWLHAVPITLE